VPTRAEVSDIANAVLEQADCIMLSGETTSGKYPLECVQTMQRIAKKMEAAPQSYISPPRCSKPHRTAAEAAARLAQEDHHAASSVFTRNGNLPAVLSAVRPRHCPITPHGLGDSLKHLLLHWVWSRS